MPIAFDREKILEVLANDAEFALAARLWTATIRLDQGVRADDLRIEDGRPVSFSDGTGDEFDVRIAAPEDGWPQFLAALPAAKYRDFVVADPKELRLDGDLVTHVGPYMGAITRLVGVLRMIVNGIPDRPLLRDYPLEATDTAVGRYIYVTAGADRFRVYYEEAGQGTPLLLQHTAGADSREWRHLLADPDMQKRYRMIAYDLPFHGKSLPPLTGRPWWEHEYAPTKSDLHAWIVGIKRALNLDRPIFMGVSMGGQLAPELIGHFPAEFRAAVAVNGFYHMDALAHFDNEPYHDPRISPEYFAARMYPLTSMDAPEAFRREVVWIYASNGPAVYKGDNEYFIRGHDLRVDGHLIDTDRTPLAVLAGSEDVSFLPGTEDSGSRALGASIPGARLKILQGMSHFAMTDDPLQFNALIKPVLDELDDASTGSSSFTAE